MHVRTWIPVMVLVFMLTNLTVDPALAAKPARGGRHDFVKIVLGKAPKLVRTGALLYSLRLELLHAFFTKETYDKDTGKLVKETAKTAWDLGLEVIDLVATLRRRALGGVYKRWGWHRPWRKNAPGQAKTLWKRGFQARKRMGGHLRALLRGLELTEDQRYAMKLISLAWTPEFVRLGGQGIADGIAFARALMAPKLDRDVCEQKLSLLCDHFREILEYAVKLAFTLRAELTKAQVHRLLANLPLRLLFLR